MVVIKSKTVCIVCRRFFDFMGRVNVPLLDSLFSSTILINIQLGSRSA
jgi:hypothetical protein